MNRPSLSAQGRDVSCLDHGLQPVNISKPQQHTLHALAQGGAIVLERDEDTGDVIAADCITRDGWRLTDCTLPVFRALKRKRFIASRDGGPYRITREGLVNLRSQLDNRVTAKRQSP